MNHTTRLGYISDGSPPPGMYVTNVIQKESPIFDTLEKGCNNIRQVGITFYIHVELMGNARRHSCISLSLY